MDDVTEPGFGQQQEIVRAAAPHAEGRHDATLRGQEQAGTTSASWFTSFESSRCRRSPASGPRTATYDRVEMRRDA